MDGHSSKLSDGAESTTDGGFFARPRAAVEVGLIFVLFFLVAGWLPPDVNEAHYLSKARHYWEPSWCPDDLFLNSADAHTVFYWTFGWLTCWLPLVAVAWVGRLTTWLLLAWSWRRLSFALMPRPLAAVLSAAVFLPLQMGGQMAGEWVVGGVEAKGFAYVLVLLGLEALVRQRWPRVWILFGAAAAFHVLVGGWSVLAGAVAYGLAGSSRPPLRKMLPSLLLGGLLSLPGLLPAIALNAGQVPDTLREADQVYVYLRLPHHLVPAQFSQRLVLAHLLVAALWLATAWSLRGDAGQRRLHTFVAGAATITLVGLLVSWLPQHPWSTGLLRFYWFRLGDVAIPLGAAMGVCGTLLGWLTGSVAASGSGREAGPGHESGADRKSAPHRNAGRFHNAGSAALTAVLLLCVGFLAQHSWRQLRDFRPPAEKQTRPAVLASPDQLRNVYEDWVRLGRWIQDNTEPEAVFITPRMQQTFHWFGERAEVASWKNVPQDAASLRAWWDRLQQLYPPEVVQGGLVRHGPEELIRLAGEFGADYVILDRTISRRPLALPRLYPNSLEENVSFEVYRIPPRPPGLPKTPAADGGPSD